MRNTSKLALAFATIERPHAVQRLIRSVRKYYPDLPIYVADQSKRIEPMTAFYEQMRVNLLRMPYDAGVCASRNRLAACIEEPYFVLCDDDFLFSVEIDFGDALKILERHSEIGVVGGRLIDLGDDFAEIRRWELYLAYDPANRILTSIPIDEFAPVVRDSGNIRYYLCDAVLNFGVMRRAIFSSAVKWDERFKSNGEHEDFFLNLKVNSSHRVAYLPTMLAYHHHPAEYGHYRSRLRERPGGWREFMRKWGIDQYLEAGRCVRTINEPELEVNSSTAHDRFFLNSGLSFRRSAPAGDVLEVVSFDRIAAVGALDSRGMPAARDAKFSRLLIRKQGEHAITAVPPGSEEARQAKPAAQPPEYALESRRQPAAGAFFPEHVYFRYDPAVHEESDFVIWYRGGPVSSDATAFPVVLRWFDRHGRVLLWETEPRMIEDLNERYWKPLLIEPPPFGRELGPLRFEILEAHGPNRIPGAIGFAVRPQDGARPGGNHGIRTSWDVMMLCQPRTGKTRVLAANSYPNIDLTSDALIESGGVRSVEVSDGLLFLDFDPRAGFERLFFVDWQCLGKALLQIDLGHQVLESPRLIAVPDSRGVASRARLFGYDSKRGVRQIRTWRSAKQHLGADEHFS